MILPAVGEAGQARLASAHAAVVGCGALGCASLDLLARAGVGRITLIDRDIVEWTNLQRQTLFAESDAAEGLPKAIAAANRLRAANSTISIEPHIADLTASNAAALLALGTAHQPQVILDGTDNFATRYLLNDIAVMHTLVYAYGGVIAGRGMVMPVLPRRGPCLRCLLDEPPPPGGTETCDTAGVFGPAVAIVAAAQAAEALKVLMGRDDLVSTTLLEFDLFANQRRRLAVARRDDCPCCGMHIYEFLNSTREQAPIALCGRCAIQIAGPGAPLGETPAVLDLAALGTRLSPHGETRVLPFMLRTRLRDVKGDEGNPVELTVFRDGRAIVHGTTREELARSIYARFVGG